MMSTLNLRRALTAGLLTCGMAAVASFSAQAQDVFSIPKGHVTLVGCFLHMPDPTDPDDLIYALANPTLGPVASVPDPNCYSTGSEPILELTDVRKHHLDEALTGRWMEIYGELGKFKDADDLREFEVNSFREVPATVIPPAPVATTGFTPRRLPHTASPLPLIAMLGLFAVAGGLVLGRFGRRRTPGRG